MSYYSPSIEKLIQSFEKLPSIGNKTAARLAFYILNASEEETNEFVSSIVNAKKNLKYCSKCYNIYFYNIEENVDIENISVGEDKTSFTEVMSIVGGQRTFFTYPGASADFGLSDMNFEKNLLSNSTNHFSMFMRNMKLRI